MLFDSASGDGAAFSNNEITGGQHALVLQNNDAATPLDGQALNDAFGQAPIDAGIGVFDGTVGVPSASPLGPEPFPI